MEQYYTDGKKYYKENTFTVERFELTESQYKQAIKKLKPYFEDTNLSTINGPIQKRIWR